MRLRWLTCLYNLNDPVGFRRFFDLDTVKEVTNEVFT